MPLAKKEHQTITVTYQRDVTDSNFDVLSKLNAWADFEDSGLIDDLPHLGAVIDLWQLVTVVYDTDNIDAVREIILSHEADFKPWNDFVNKYSLNWIKFKKAVRGKTTTIVTY